MGHALDPNNPLYSPQEGGARPATEFAAPVAAAADTEDMGEPTQGLMEADLTAEDMSTDLDFDADQVLQVSAPETETVSEKKPAVAPVIAETPEEEIGALEFDLDAFAEKPLEIPQATEVAPTAEEEQGLEFDLDELMPHLAPVAAEAAAPVEPAAQEILLEEPTQAGGLELDLDAFTAPAETEAASAPAQPSIADAEADLDFSLELPATEQEAPQPAASADESIVIESAPAPEQESHLDFDFDIGSELMPAAMEEKSPAPMPELDLSGISLDLEEAAPSTIAATSGESEDGLAEVATKLDLARAYVEMGDKDGAREILEEVLKEGGAQQQADANQLLASL
jgi:pilus assembly protein FimV